MYGSQIKMASTFSFMCPSIPWNCRKRSPPPLHLQTQETFGLDLDRQHCPPIFTSLRTEVSVGHMLWVRVDGTLFIARTMGRYGLEQVVACGTALKGYFRRSSF